MLLDKRFGISVRAEGIEEIKKRVCFGGSEV